MLAFPYPLLQFTCNSPQEDLFHDFHDFPGIDFRVVGLQLPGPSLERAL